MAVLLALVGTGAFWATSSLAARSEGSFLSKAAQETVICEVTEEGKTIYIIESGTTFETTSSKALEAVAARVGSKSRTKSGQNALSLNLLGIGGSSFAEGIGETKFWLDATRPVESAIWEKTAGTNFPAIQEMRFHFFYSVESMPGKIFRSINPAIMRSDDVKAFPPPPGTLYQLVQTVDLEEIHEPGVVAAQVLSNRVRVQPSRTILPNYRGE